MFISFLIITVIVFVVSHSICTQAYRKLQYHWLHCKYKIFQLSHYFVGIFIDYLIIKKKNDENPSRKVTWTPHVISVMIHTSNLHNLSSLSHGFFHMIHSVLIFRCDFYTQFIHVDSWFVFFFFHAILHMIDLFDSFIFTWFLCTNHFFDSRDLFIFTCDFYAWFIYLIHVINLFSHPIFMIIILFEFMIHLLSQVTHGVSCGSMCPHAIFREE